MMMDINFEDQVRDFQKVVGGDQEPFLYRALIVEEVEEFNEAILRRFPEEAQLKELVDIVYVAIGYAVSKGWDFTTAFNLVHYNNMGRMRQDDGTILRREDGKVIKNPNYPKVNLGGCV